VSKEGQPGEGRVFANQDEVLKALDAGVISVHSKIKIRGLKRFEDEDEASYEKNPNRLMETTAGHVILNSAFPNDFPFQNYLVKKKEVAALVERCARLYDKKELAETLDALKDIGFTWATKAGVMLLPITLVQTASSTLSGLIVHWVGRYRECVLFGWLCWSIGLGLISTLDETSGLAKQIGYSLLIGVGVGNTLQP
jgi:hypothetical protein